MPQVAVLRSPTQKYELRLNGHIKKPLLPVVSLPLVAEGKLGSRVLFTNLELYSADWLDRPFRGRFGGPHWPAENAVRFTGPRFDAAGCDALSVRNRTRKPVAFVHVFAWDMVLIMDLASDSRLSVPITPHQVDQSGFFTVQARFADGEMLKWARRAGPDVKAGATYRYSVDITESELLLDIQELASAAFEPLCR